MRVYVVNDTAAHQVVEYMPLPWALYRESKHLVHYEEIALIRLLW